MEQTHRQESNGIVVDYPFLNHSPTTLTHDLPPDIDNKPLARQRRKRTSPEDQAVLEEAYQRDPKPDRSARLRLVQHIALGEKEVQIWFQNRRQTSRRKSRPLLPHEIAQFQMSRYGRSSFDFDDASEQFDAPDSSSEESLHPSSEPTRPADTEPALAALEVHVFPTLPAEQSEISATASWRSCGPRRSTPTPEQIHDKPIPMERPLQKASSFIRLSMTANGNAKVSTKDGFSPSPPRPEPVMSQPAPVAPKLDLQASIPTLKRSLSGRSRDSRAWEFWCDKECRSELEEKAEKDGKGSAADAIGVLRATRKALQPITQRHNVVYGRPQPRLGKLADSRQRPSLQRAHTSGGRLQSADRPLLGHAKKIKIYEPALVDADCSTYIPGNESDKENWSPGAENALTEGRKEKAITARIGQGPRGLKRSSAYAVDAENHDPEADKEVASFMRKGRNGSSYSGAEELDCVQGLLSLSQGTWAR